MKYIKALVVPVAFFALSLLLEFVSSKTAFDNFLQQYLNPESFQRAKELVEIVNYLILVLPLFYQATSRGFASNKCSELTRKMGINNRAKLAAILRDAGYIEGNQEDINIRIFRKKRGRLVLKDLEGFCARTINDKLSFSIKKKEGLCVKAYLEKSSKLELERANKDEYHLNGRQKALAGDLQFIVAVPICNESGSSVKYVICFDSFRRIAKAGSEEGIIKICEDVAYDISSIID